MAKRLSGRPTARRNCVFIFEGARPARKEKARPGEDRGGLLGEGGERGLGRFLLFLRPHGGGAGANGLSAFGHGLANVVERGAGRVVVGGGAFANEVDLDLRSLGEGFRSSDFFDGDERVLHVLMGDAGGAFEDRYHLSLRTDLDYAEAYGLLASVLDGEGSFGGRGPVAGGQVPLPAGDDHALRTLERRLRARALRLALADGPPGTPLKSGTRLTRLS